MNNNPFEDMDVDKVAKAATRSLARAFGPYEEICEWEEDDGA